MYVEMRVGMEEVGEVMVGYVYLFETKFAGEYKY